MATFLDLTGLEQFSSFFVFIFVWLMVWAILSYAKTFGDNKAVSILIGLVISVFVLLSPTVTGAIAYIAPWVALVFVFVMLLKLVLHSFGATDMDLYAPLKSVFMVIIIIALIVGVMSYIRDRTVLPGDEDGSVEYDFTKATNVVFHPKVLGIIFIFVIAVFTIALLVGKYK
jgi:hypothetical protein|tara:strand:+ start:249 stop:764 length:516 start_codon:yes stop_codon:yes gene_type:complete